MCDSLFYICFKLNYKLQQDLILCLDALWRFIAKMDCYATLEGMTVSTGIDIHCPLVPEAAELRRLDTASCWQPRESINFEADLSALAEFPRARLLQRLPLPFSSPTLLLPHSLHSSHLTIRNAALFCLFTFTLLLKLSHLATQLLRS